MQNWEYLCAHERIRDLHDWRSFAGLNSLCDICLLCLRPLLCSCLSLSFIPLFLDLSFHPSLFSPSMKMSNSCPSSDGQLWLNKSETERESERGGGGIWPPQLWRKDFITSCQISSCCRRRISEAGPKRDCLRMYVCWKLKEVQ